MNRFSKHGASWALLISMAIGVAACGGEEAPPPVPDAAQADAAQAAEAPDTSEAAPADTAQVRVEEFQFTRLEDGTRVLTGYLANPTDEPIAQAQIQVSLLDENNVRVGETTIVVQDIAPGNRRPFNQPIGSDQENIQGASVESVLLL